MSNAVNRDPAFEGIFNGNGHKIIGLYVSNPGYGGLWGSGSGYNAGLFGKIRYGEVANLKIEKAFLRAFGNVGAITAESQGAFFINNEVTDPEARSGSGGNRTGIIGKYDNTSTITLGKDNSSGGIGVANCLVTNCNWLSSSRRIPPLDL